MPGKIVYAICPICGKLETFYLSAEELAKYHALLNGDDTLTVEEVFPTKTREARERLMGSSVCNECSSLIMQQYGYADYAVM